MTVPAPAPDAVKVVTDVQRHVDGIMQKSKRRMLIEKLEKLFRSEANKRTGKISLSKMSILLNLAAAQVRKLGWTVGWNDLQKCRNRPGVVKEMMADMGMDKNGDVDLEHWMVWAMERIT